MAEHKSENAHIHRAVAAVALDSRFCGTLCEGNGGLSDIICACGHSGCAVPATVGAGTPR